jgi:hypothetical protein
MGFVFRRRIGQHLYDRQVRINDDNSVWRRLRSPGRLMPFGYEIDRASNSPAIPH